MNNFVLFWLHSKEITKEETDKIIRNPRYHGFGG